jgi:uncharacterized protein YceH (UPF0502 family)
VELTELEARVLGCLIEKRATTPDHYPLSTNALTNACNQKSSREPVMDVAERDVVAAMMELRADKLCRTAISGRTDKHKHVLDELWNLSEQQLAAVAIPLLRGPQSPGEIRIRTERYVAFESLEDVERTLHSLADEVEGVRPGLVINLGRGPGQSQDRWMHLLAGSPDPDALASAIASSGSSAGSGPSRTERIDQLEATVASLETRLARLEAELGVSLTPQPDELS